MAAKIGLVPAYASKSCCGKYYSPCINLLNSTEHFPAALLPNPCLLNPSHSPWSSSSSVQPITSRHHVEVIRLPPLSFYNTLSSSALPSTHSTPAISCTKLVVKVFTFLIFSHKSTTTTVRCGITKLCTYTEQRMDMRLIRWIL